MDKVQVTNASGQVLELPIASSPGGFIVQDIDGLDPNKALFTSTILSTMDGEEYQASRGDKRQITFTLGYSLGHPSTVKARRRELYKFFTPRAKLLLRFFDSEMPVTQIEVYVEDVDAPQFTKDPFFKATTIAFKPDFLTDELITFSGMTTKGTDFLDLPYAGTVETGFLFTLNSQYWIQNFTIDLIQPNGPGAQFDFRGYVDVNNPVFELNTLDGSKGAWTIKTDGTRRSVLNQVASSSDWPQLQPGSNAIRVRHVDGGGSNPPIAPFTLSYRARYGGL